MKYTPRHAQIIDLMQALKQSIEKAKPKQKAAAQRKAKTASTVVSPVFICLFFPALVLWICRGA